MKIELNHWFVKDNELSIALLEYFVKIEVLSDNGEVYYNLIVAGKNEILIFGFHSLEDAISLTENTIANSYSDKDIVESFIEQNKSKTLVKRK